MSMSLESRKDAWAQCFAPRLRSGARDGRPLPVSSHPARETQARDAPAAQAAPASVVRRENEGPDPKHDSGLCNRAWLQSCRKAFPEWGRDSAPAAFRAARAFAIGLSVPREQPLPRELPFVPNAIAPPIEISPHAADLSERQIK